MMSEEVKPKQNTNSKKTASYTYWVDEKSKGHELPEEQKPKKIDAPPQASHEYSSIDKGMEAGPRSGIHQGLGRSAMWR